MKQTWKVKYNGKLDILIAIYAAIMLVYMFIILRGTLREGGDFFENLWMGFWIFGLFVIAAIIVPITMLRKKVIPNYIAIDPDKQLVEMQFFKNRKALQIDIEALSCQKIERSFFTILVFYEKRIATRGHTIHVELLSIIAPSISTSWTRKKAYEILNKLKAFNIEMHVPAKSKPILDYLLG